MADAVKGPVDLSNRRTYLRNSPGLRSTSLDDKYDLTKRRIFVSGPQAIVRLLLMQKELDRRNRSRHGGFYLRLSRLAARRSRLDFLARQAPARRGFDILFQPGLNEDLAATAIWGAQQAEMRGEGKYDGVFSLWYGKGPGVDRSGDVLAPRQSRGHLETWRRAGPDGR